MMLNPRKTDQSASVSSNSQSYSNTAYSAPAPSSSTFDRHDETGPSIVNKHLTMKGDLESEGDVLVKGRVIGNIKCKLLIVDVDALVDGGVEAEEVVIRGKTKGTIRANKVKLEKSATVDSEIEHHVFSAEEGARIKGAMRYLEEPFNRTNLTLVA